MGEYVEVVKTFALTDGQMKSVGAGGRELLVARVGDSFFAAENTCPHMGGKLAQGELEGTVVTCPLHASQFDLRDGRVVRWTNWPRILAASASVVRRPRALRTYPVKVEGDKVLVEI